MHLQGLKAGEPIRSIRITRVGQAARDFKTDDEAFKTLMGTKAPKAAKATKATEPTTKK